MSSCIKDNQRCHLNGSLVNCCSGLCLQQPGQQYAKCEEKKRSTSTTARSCLGEGKQCHYEGNLGTCCSFNCNQLSGQPFGTCVGSTPPDLTNIPVKCLDLDANCTLDGRFGFCCSTYCHIISPHTVGGCKPSNKTSDSGGNTWIIFGAVAVPVLIIIIVGFAWLYYRQRKMEKGFLTYAETRLFFNGDPESVFINSYAHEKVENMPYNKNLEVSESDFQIDRESSLGSGCFGLVLKGKVRNTDVAVKTVRNAGVDATHLRALLMEIKILQYIGQFENIVSMVGSNTSNLKEGKVYLFLEYCPLGSLEKVLRANKYNFKARQDSSAEESQYQNTLWDPNRNSALTENDLLTWCLQITNGMRYLAEKRVIHADLATRNVLLLGKECAKITDFGLSRRLYEYSNYVKQHQEPLPWRWMALESLQQLSFSHQSDVWSLGVTFWEIYTLGDTPYPGLSWTGVLCGIWKII